MRSGDQSPTGPTNTPSEVSPAGAPYDDRYRHLNVPGTQRAAQGWNRHVGQARFYPGPLPPQFGTESPSVDSYITRQRPDGWTGAGTRHDCYAEWSRRSGGASPLPAGTSSARATRSTNRVRGRRSRRAHD